MAKTNIDNVYIATRNIMPRIRSDISHPELKVADKELWEALDEACYLDRCSQVMEAKHEDHILLSDGTLLKQIQISFAEKLSQLDRSTLDISVKLFLHHLPAQIISIALHHVMKELGVNVIDTIILSQTDHVSIRSDVMSSLWKVVLG
jgi:hypothetical protein